MDTEEITIDEMRVEDIPEACALWYSIPELGVSVEFDTPARIETYLERNPGFSTVARNGNRIVGAIMCGHDGRRGSFYLTGVLPEFRRQSIAKRMVERSLARLRDIGLTTAFCFTAEKNLTAQAFWRGTGWEYCPWVQYNYREFPAERQDGNTESTSGMEPLNFTPIPSHGRGIVLRLLQESYKAIPQIDERLIAEWEDGWRGYDDDIFTYPETIGTTGFVTCLGETIVGFASWDPRQRPVAMIGHNCVLPAFRRNGYGRRQIEETLRRLRASGFRKARVTTGDHPGFIAAQKMYLSCGFREAGRFSEPTRTDASWKVVEFVAEL